jgi:ABC-2 type transport system permease protein
MNIFRRELRAGRKAFLFWMIGMFLLCFTGIIKYESYSVSGSMEELLSAFPRVVLAVMGVAGVDMNTLSGYTALLFYYIIVCAVVYAVILGAAAVCRESVDRTHEFIYTKPRSRARILAAKLSAAGVYIALFSLMNAGFAYLAAATLKSDENVAGVIAACTLAAFLVGILFVALAAFLATLAQKPEKGSLYGNLAFLAAFVLGVVYNMLENPGALRLVSPINYFTSSDLAAAHINPLFVLLALALAAFLLFGAFRRFARRDLV